MRGSLSLTFLVIERDLRDRVRSRYFKVATGLLCAVAAGSILAPSYFGDSEPEVVDVGIAPGSPAAAEDLLDSFNRGNGDLRVDVMALDSDGEGIARLEEGDLDLMISADELVVADAPEVGSSVAGIVNVLSRSLASLQALESAGIPTDAALGIVGAQPTPVRVAGDGAARSGADQNGLLFVGLILLYIALLQYGQWIASGVVEEKTSRVVEVLLSVITPRQLLAGKVVGIGLAGLVQMAAVAAAVMLALVQTGVGLPSGGGMTMASLGLWFILGYALYACAFAALGALANRPEDAQQAAFPLYAPLVGGYLAAIAAVNSPDTSLVRILSLFPPTAPFVMPVRAAMSSVSPVEIAVAVALMLVATAGVITLGAKVYSEAALRFGAKVKLRQALAAARAQPS